MAENQIDMGSVAIAARQRPMGWRGRSPVYDLMWDNYAQLAPELNRPRRPNWQAVAKALGDQGILDGAGQALTATSAETVRKTWWKVNRDKDAMAAGTMRRRQSTGQPTQVAGEAAKSVQATPSTPAATIPAANLGMLPPGIEPPGEAPRRFTFEFASAKDWTKETDKGGE